VKVEGVPYRTIWLGPDGGSVEIIDQTKLPHHFETRRLESLEDALEAITAMRVRGAPLIGATAAYGLCLALRADPSDAMMAGACERLFGSRPTAVDLKAALDDMRRVLANTPPERRVEAAYRRAAEICEENVEACAAIGEHGLELIEQAWRARGQEGRVNILTHCNAGWLATVDWGTALAPIYRAHGGGIPLHVWVDETRPRNQGAALTAWELKGEGVPHTVIVDNAGGHLMQRGLVDICIVGTDRTTAAGDVCNKIGTYLKALAAKDSGVPFYVALPGSSIDWTIAEGAAIPIEERPADEVLEVTGRAPDGSIASVAIAPAGSAAANYAFDVTPARLVSAFITERGLGPATSKGLLQLYPERR
jgi:methylthioribose-1-phosphate isomerase